MSIENVLDQARKAVEVPFSTALRLRFHRPKYPEAKHKLEPRQYLRLPFRAEDLAHWQKRPSQVGIGTKIDYSVSEGWLYSKRVRRALPRAFGHGAVDFHLPYGFPVSAPCDGLAMSSYASYPLFDKKGNVKKVNGLVQRFGLGYFVQIYNRDEDRFVQLGHLANITTEIPFSIPVKKNGRWQATGHILEKRELTAGNPGLTFVKAGETIGYVGYSGLTEVEDYKKGADRPFVINPGKIGSWSIPHIHMDEFQRNLTTGEKDWRRDPYDIYREGDSYPTHTNLMEIGKNPLLLTDALDRPLFADR